MKNTTKDNIELLHSEFKGNETTHIRSILYKVAIEGGKEGEDAINLIALLSQA